MDTYVSIAIINSPNRFVEHLHMESSMQDFQFS